MTFLVLQRVVVNFLFMFSFFSVADCREPDDSSQSPASSTADGARVLGTKCVLLDACSQPMTNCSAKGTALASQNSVTVTEDLFYELFKASNLRAWMTISTDPIFLLPNSKHGKQIVSIASLISTNKDSLNCELLVAALCNIFVNRLFLSQSDFDSFIRQLHCIRTSSELENVFTAFIDGISHSSGIAALQLSKVMYQIWLRRISEGMLIAIRELYSREISPSELPGVIDSTDQNVLYYICGYMVQKLSRAGIRHRKLGNVDILVSIFTSKEPIQDNHFVKQYQTWTEKQSRGGLRFAVPDFYMLVREFDNIYRTVSIAQVIGCRKVEMLSLIFDGFMVKYYWSKLLVKSDIDELKSLPVLDYLINLFVTIKGFAVARKEKDRLSKKVRSVVSSSKSLRGKLKSNGVNRKAASER